jgi:cupin fold WbuC family metalloprotein
MAEIKVITKKTETSWIPPLVPYGLKQIVTTDDNLISRVCLHDSPRDSLAVMVIRLDAHSVTVPHYLKTRKKFLYVANGTCELLLYKTTSEKILNSTIFLRGGSIIQIPKMTPHSIATNDHEVVLLEVLSGRFRKNDRVLLDDNISLNKY